MLEIFTLKVIKIGYPFFKWQSIMFGMFFSGHGVVCMHDDGCSWQEGRISRKIWILMLHINVGSCNCRRTDLRPTKHKFPTRNRDSRMVLGESHRPSCRGLVWPRYECGNCAINDVRWHTWYLPQVSLDSGRSSADSCPEICEHEARTFYSENISVSCSCCSVKQCVLRLCLVSSQRCAVERYFDFKP